MGPITSFSFIHITKWLLYFMTTLLTPFIFHKSILSTENNFLRSRQYDEEVHAQDLVPESMVQSTLTKFMTSSTSSDRLESTLGYQNGILDNKLSTSTSSDTKADTNSDTNPDTDSSTKTTTTTSTMYTSEALTDQITNLPGLTFSPTFQQFSGYFQVSPTRKIFYWYIESTHNPSSDPLIWWSNGGPGCSGLLGLGTEFGPFYFGKNGTLTENPFTWNTMANIIYVEQPAGVGFGTYNNATDARVDDERAAQDSFEMIRLFLERFPERKENELYLASESFGGHYIPHLTKTILDQNDKGEKPVIDNFRGFLVGNPYVDPFSNDQTMIQTYYMHGLIALPIYSLWEKHCLDRNNYNERFCGKLMNIMMQLSGDDINPYALDFPICTEASTDSSNPVSNQNGNSATSMVQISSTTPSPNDIQASKRWMSSQSLRLINATTVKTPSFLPKADVYHPCAESHLFEYLNRNDVRKALHVETDKEWTMCTDDIQYSDEDSNRPQIHLYKELIVRAKKSGHNLKMMVYSGDDDSICSTASTQYWIWDLGVQAQPKGFWNPWQFENQTAGYVTNFDLGKTESSFTFATVHGAGHEVPAYRPAEGLAMLQSFLSGTWNVENTTL